MVRVRPLIPFLLLIHVVVLPAVSEAGGHIPTTGTTTLVSVSPSGERANSDSAFASISASGRFVAFMSDASNLVPGDTNISWDVFVYDRRAAKTVQASVNSLGQKGNGRSTSPSISADGRYVAFASYANNLVPGDTNNELDIFVHDRTTGRTTRVSVSSSGEQANKNSNFPAITPDGRYIAFASYASNLVPGDTKEQEDVFVHDQHTGTTTRASVSSTGREGNGFSSSPQISADGRYVVFLSGSTNLVRNDTNGSWDIFLHDLSTRKTTRVSVSPSGEQANDDSSDPSISADGRYIAFATRANNLVAGDTDTATEVIVHDMSTRRNTLISVSPSGRHGYKDSFDPSISVDGRYVAFMSHASLVPGDTNGFLDIFVRDTRRRVTIRASVSSSGEQGNQDSSDPAISASGRHVVFWSLASNLVSGDTNGFYDVFAHETTL